MGKRYNINLNKFNIKLSILTYFMMLILFCVCPNIANASGSAVYEFSYTGDYQTFVVPTDGYYKLEVYGAQGGYRSSSSYAGKGGYTSGNVYLTKGTVLYIYVGGNGKTNSGWNGGGMQATFKTYGGGATDIRFVSGDWNSSEGLLSRLIVAGGGGTDGKATYAGGAGGLTGGSSTGCGSGGNGASLSGAGSLRAGFGYGGSGTSGSGGYGGAGGGGWYGGGGATPDSSADDDKGGGGGSSWAWNSQIKSYAPSGYSVSTDYYLSDVSYSSGVRSDDGFARITALKTDGIESIEINRGDVEIDFQYDVYSYYLTIDNDVTNVNFNIEPKDGITLVQDNRRTDVTNLLSVTNTVTITDEETGLTTVYTINVRKQNYYMEDRDSVSYGYSYTGSYEKFYVPATGIYTLETWGAQGGSRGSYSGGNGSYSKAEMYLVKGEVLYVYVGGSGNQTDLTGTIKGWNGGGHTDGYYSTGGVWHESTNTYGGGASDIRYGGTSLYNRVLVAGGGGSAGKYAGGAGWVSASNGCGSGGTAGSYTSGGSYRAGFGYGGSGTIGNDGYGGAGGGGWYGGGGANPDSSADDDKGGGGGSSYAFTESLASYAPDGYLVTSKNYLDNATLYNGATSFTSPTGTTETGHSGNGYVRISPKLINGVSSITINDGDIPIDFEYTTYTYYLPVLDSVDSITVNLIPNEGYTIVESYSGTYDFSSTTEYTYSVDVINDITGLTVNYTIYFNKQSSYLMDGTTGSYGYSYIGYPQKFVAPAAGIYTIEAWGAQGGYRSTSSGSGGKGGYSTGEIFLNKGQIIYIYVGSSGNNGGWNGGGYQSGTGIYGGGASDVRINGMSLYNRLLVAGGGGSVGKTNSTGGCGGGTSGCSGSKHYGTAGGGASQTSGGSGNITGTFGQGAAGTTASGGYGGAGGGGWYGGGGAGVDSSSDDDSAGGGGSGFVWTSESSSNVPDAYLVSENYYLSNASTIAGNASMPNTTGTGTMTGKTGNGYVKISFSLEYDFEISVSDNVTLDKEFDYDEKEYTGTLSSNDSSLVTFTVSDSESILKVDGDGTQEIHVGDNTFEITITYINGAVEVFTYNIHREANDIDYLNNIYFDEFTISDLTDGATSFDKDTLTYNITLPYYMDEYELTVDKGSADQVITNIGHIENKNNSYSIAISVTNETGTSTRVYVLNITLPHSSKLKNIHFVSSGGTEIDLEVPNDETELSIEFESHIAAMDAQPEVYDAEAEATVTGDGYIENEEYDITIVVTEPHVDTTTYVIHVKRVVVSGYEKGLTYTGSVQTIVIPYSHEYLLQVWGAQGGNSGGRGGYSYGTIYLEKGTILYAYAGGSGNNGGWNGGGTSKAGYGGGASDIRISTDSLYSRVIVAGGGGGHGSDGCASGGAGGGTTGIGGSSQGSCGTQAGGGTQVDGGSYGIYGSALGSIGKFGRGANASTSGGSWYGGGGGGGWYGGGSGSTSGWSNGGGGGSGFIYTEETASTIETNSDWLLDSTYYLTDAATYSGTQTFESTSGGTEAGHTGNGYVKVSIPYVESENNFLDGIIVNKGTLTPSEWDYNEDTYYLTLDTDEVEINVEGVPADGKASVVGNGDYIIEAGTTEISLVVTSESGAIKTYTLVVTREKDSNGYPQSIAINGLLTEYCSTFEGNCAYTFDANTHEYTVTVPYQIREIVMVVNKGHYFQTVQGDGIYALEGGSNEIDIFVTSEDESDTEEYKYNIVRNMDGNADLKSLKLLDPEYELNYSYNITDYYVTVPNETESVTLEAIPDDENATVNIDYPSTLDYGLNAITITVTPQVGTEKVYTVYVTRLESDNAFLSSLNVYDITEDEESELSLTPTFNKINLTYTLNVGNEVTKLRFDATSEDELSTIEGTGEYDLSVGLNTITIKSIAQDESSLTYTVNVTREANSNALLSSLELEESAFTESFDSNKFVYYVYVTGEVETATINATTVESTSSWKIIGSTTLVAGKNELIVRVTAEDGSTCDYKIIINRTGYSSSELSSLNVSNGSEVYTLTPAFDSLYETYTLELENDVTNVTITAIADSSKRAKIGTSTVFVKNVNLLTDNPSTTTITVTAEDGTVTNYSLTITREKSSNNTLSSLVVDNNILVPDFDSDTLVYDIITNDHSINIIATPTNKFATVSISGNYNALEVGSNEITITVTPETGDARVYTLNVIRELSTDSTLSSLVINNETLTPDFVSSTFDYTITTNNSSVSITAIPTNKYASYVINGSYNSLSEGENTIEIVVTAEDGSTSTYTIIITYVLDDNNYLSSLTTSAGLNETFDKETTSYTVTTEDESITITPVLDSKYASYVITDAEGNAVKTFPTDLSLGENTFIITVTAQNHEVKIYTLVVTREQHSDSKLKSLTTSAGLNETFATDTLSYTATTTEHTIDIVATVRESHATAIIYDSEGNVIEKTADLITGTNTFSIVVTAPSGDITTYSLVVTRNEKDIATIDSVSFVTSPTFNKNTFTYTVATDETSLNLDDMVLTDPYSTYVVDGNANFENDVTTTVTIIVTSESGNVSNTYTFDVTKVLSTDSSLKYIKFAGYELTPELASDVFEYDVYVPKSLTAINLNTITSKNTAVIRSIKVDGTEVTDDIITSFDKDITISPSTGSVVLIKVEAEDGSTSTYTINVLDENLKNNYLLTLNASCGDLDPVFDRETQSYVVYIADTDTECNIVATAEADTSTVTGAGSYTLALTEKKVTATIKVTSYVGEDRDYTVLIRRGLSSEARLASLSIGDYNFNETFDPDTYEYTITLPNSVTSLSEDNISYTTVDEDTTVNIPTMSLSTKKTNAYKITTKSEDGNVTKTYTINVTRTKSNVASIESFEVTVGSEKFTCTPEDNVCSVDIPSETESFKVSAILSDEATVSPVNNTSYTIASTEYSKDLTFVVTAENGTDTAEYTLTVNRSLSDVNDLMSISINGVSLDNFSSNILEYSYTVKGTISQALISVELASTKSTLVTDLSNAFDLEYGTNVINITVRSESGSEKTYIVNIRRSDSEDATLTYLAVKDYEFEEKFDPEETEYTVRVPRSKTTLTKDEILYTLSNEDASITFDKTLTIDFVNNQYNIYNVTVTAGNGIITKTYRISVLPILETNNEIDYVTVGGENYYDTDSDNVIDVDIFDDETEAILTNIVLKGEYSTYSETLPITITYGTPINLTITAENGDIRTYTVELVQTKTRELKLANIVANFDDDEDCDEICTFDTTFDEDTYNYTIYVPNEVTYLYDLEVTTKNSFQTYSIIGNSGFEVGSNTVIIRVKNSLDETLDYTLEVIREANSDPTLVGINFITPEYEITDFDSYVYEYNVEMVVDSGKYELETIKKNVNQKVTISGAKVLYFGKNDIIVTSQSESCSVDVKTRAGCNEAKYYIHAYRYEKYSNLLSSLTISSGSEGDLLQTFNKYNFDYTITVESEISTVKIEGTAADEEHATVKLYDSSNNELTDSETSLKIGLNTFKLIVTPEIGDSATYYVNIIRSADSNVNLEKLWVTGYDLDPTFDKAIVNYAIDVDSTVNSLDIHYETEDSDSIVYISGNSNFTTGENIVNVIVQSGDKTRGKTYRIVVTKAASPISYLNNLQVSSGSDDSKVYYSLSPTFDKDTLDYEVTVPSNINIVNIETTKGNSKQVITGNGSYALDYGENIVTVVVTAEAGNTSTYQVTVNREYEFGLNSLTVTSDDTTYVLSPNYSDDVDEYTVSVPYEVTSVEVDATLKEELDSISGLGVYDLSTGDNTIQIIMTYGEDETSRIVTITVNRAKCSDNSLISLSVAEGVIDPIFDNDTKSYTVDIPYEYDSATILTETTSDVATVEVTNNTGLEVGVPQDITVKVIAENGESNTYTITAKRLEKAAASNRLTNMYIDEGTLEPEYDIALMNYSVDVTKDTKRVTLHIVAEESNYSEALVYKLGSTTTQSFDLTATDPHVSLSVDSGKNVFIIKVTNYEGSIRNYQLTVYRSGPNEARIKSLKFNKGELSPTFDKNKNSYTMTVDTSVSSIYETIEMVDSLATYTISGNKNLKVGDNVVTITTLAQDGKTSLVYTVVVTKKASDNAYLSNIATFPEKDFEFDKTTYSYTYHIANDVNTVQVIGIREDTKASITGNGIYTVTGNSLTITLTVTAESGNVKVYTIYVTRELEDNNYLSSLITNNGELVPDFDKDTTDYTIEVDNYVDSITLTGTAESDKATVSGNGSSDLVVGENKRTIVVTSEKGTTRTYIVTITRKEAESAATSLDGLRVVEGELTPTFNSNVLSYVVNIPNEYDSATIIYEAHDEDATVDIYDNTDLVVGHNTVTVKVSKDGEGTIYTIDVVRQEASNTYLKDLSVSPYELNETFDKDTQEYTLNVTNDVDSISVKAVAELDSSTVYIKTSSSREYTLHESSETVTLESGKNEIYFKVVSQLNAERVYKLIVTKAVSDEANLLTLTSDVGEFDSKFDSSVKEYVLTVPVGTESVTLSGTVSDYATVTGLEKYSISVGENTKFIVVTSESGIVNTYQVKIVRNASTDATITNIVPSVGTLSPTFDSTVNSYTMEVEGDIDTMSFTVTLADKNATVKGNGTQAIFNGKNTITIVATAEDGTTTNTVTIEVTRRVDITGLDIDDEIDVPVGNDYQLEVGFVPEDTDYTGLTYSSADTSILTIDSAGLITPIKVGDTTVTITSTRNSTITKTITIHVINPTIDSDVYVINSSLKYITGMELGTTVEDFISNLKNDSSQLKVVDSTDTSDIDSDSKIVSYYKVKLVINDTVYDTLTLVIIGDVNGDGKINTTDNKQIQKRINKEITFDDYQDAAADVNLDSKWTATDIKTIKSYINKVTTSLNTDLFEKYDAGIDKTKD